MKSAFIILAVVASILAFPLAAKAADQTGFQWRGIKGWNWTPEQYLQEIPVLPELKMNFLMNCYLSLFPRTPDGKLKNEWWEPLTPARKAACQAIFTACRQHGIVFSFSARPQLCSPRPLKPQRAEERHG